MAIGILREREGERERVREERDKRETARVPAN